MIKRKLRCELWLKRKLYKISGRLCHIETESENEYVKIKSNRDRSGKYVVADSTGYRVSDEESKRLQLNSAAETIAPLNSPPTATRLLSFFDCRKTLSQIMIYLHFLAYD